MVPGLCLLIASCLPVYPSKPSASSARDPAGKDLRLILAGAGKSKMGRKPKNWSPVDEHYEAIRQDMFILFRDLRIAA
jgi:hypothetical protein